MPSTYEEIDAECQRLLAEVPLPPGCKALLAAQLQHEAGLAVRAPCVHCGGVLNVTVLDLGCQGTAPFVACPCGRSKNFVNVI